MKIKLSSGDAAVIEFLELGGGGPSWDEFECTQSGDLIFQGIHLSMRVGIFLGKPTQVIIACNKFVRIRPYPEDNKRHKLLPLNPAFPDSAWYGRSGDAYLYAQKYGYWSPDLQPTRRPSKLKEEKPAYDMIIMDAAPYYNNLGKKRK